MSNKAISKLDYIKQNYSITADQESLIYEFIESSDDLLESFLCYFKSYFEKYIGVDKPIGYLQLHLTQENKKIYNKILSHMTYEGLDSEIQNIFNETLKDMKLDKPQLQILILFNNNIKDSSDIINENFIKHELNTETYLKNYKKLNISIDSYTIL